MARNLAEIVAEPALALIPAKPICVDSANSRGTECSHGGALWLSQITG